MFATGIQLFILHMALFFINVNTKSNGLESRLIKHINVGILCAIFVLYTRIYALSTYHYTAYTLDDWALILGISWICVGVAASMYIHVKNFASRVFVICMLVNSGLLTYLL